MMGDPNNGSDGPQGLVQMYLAILGLGVDFLNEFEASGAYSGSHFGPPP